MKELTEEQKKLAAQMANDIKVELEDEIKPEIYVLEKNKDGDLGAVLPSKTEKKVNPLVDGLVEWGNTLDMENIPSGSVLLIKVNVEDHEYAHNFQMGIVRHVLEPRFEKLKEKKITVLFIGSKDDLSILTNADMEKSGWTRKEPSRIIIP